MSKRQQQPAPEPAFKVNPFAKLKIQTPDTDPKATRAAVVVPKPPGKAASLSREDAALRSALLRESGGQLLKLRFVKHGRSGRPNTILHGFEGLELSAMMEFSGALEKDLGLRGIWQECEFEIAGDHVQRLVPWLQQHGFRVMVS